MLNRLKSGADGKVRMGEDVPRKSFWCAFLFNQTPEE